MVFRAVGEAVWSLLLENSRLPDRSAVSEDGGQTWRWEDLGVNNWGDGEYLVWLWLEQHALDGEVCSEPVDLLGLPSADGIAPQGRAEEVRLEAEVETPAGTGVELEWRAGPTPVYEPESWSAWQRVEGPINVEEGVRFAQWRALLCTSDPGVNPILKQVELAAQVAIAEGLEARVVEADNEELVRSSYRFAYHLSTEKRGEVLRQRWKLDQVVGPAKTEFEAFLLLRQWVRAQWEDGWNMGEIDFCPPWDGMVVLELAHQQLGLGMCTHYATVMT